MPAAPEVSPVGRLIRLLHSFRAQRFQRTVEVSTLQRDLERAEQECARDAVTGVTILPCRRGDVAALQAELDRVAVELAHVRLAIQGVGEELARLQALGEPLPALAMGA